MTWGGDWTEAEESAFYEPFTEETGVEVVTVTPVDITKFQITSESGVYEFDISTLGEDDAKSLESRDLLEPINYDIVRRDDKDEEDLQMYMVGNGVIGDVMVYHQEAFPNGGPQTWADFWDVETYPGVRSFENNPVAAIPAALLAMGMTREEILPLDEEKVEMALTKLDELKPHINVWWIENPQSQQLLERREVDVSLVAVSTAAILVKSGVPVELVWDGALLRNAFWVVPKGTPNADLAMEFINVAARGENEAKFATVTATGPANSRAFEYLNEEDAELLPSAPSHDSVFVQDGGWWGENFDWVLERWQEWISE